MSVVWDKQVKGLHVKGGTAYYFYYRTRAGRQRRPKLADVGTITLAKAREIARELAAEVAAGRDPSEAWKYARAEQTVAELFELVWNKHWTKPRFVQSRHAKEVYRNWENHLLKPFGAKKMSEVTASDVDDWHKSLSETPAAANRTLEVFSKMFTYAEKKGLRPQNTNPCRLVDAFPEKERTRKATPDELRRLGEALVAREKIAPQGVAFVKLLLLTGARPSALERAKLQDVVRRPDGSAYVPVFGKSTADTGVLENIELSRAALKIVDTLKRPPCAYVKTPLCGGFPRVLWDKIRTDSGCKDLWARDSRRAFASVGLSGGASLEALAEILNHKSTQTTKIYAKLMEDTKSSVVDQISSRMEDLLTPSKPSL